MGHNSAMPSSPACVFCGAANAAETALWPSWIDDVFPAEDVRLEQLTGQDGLVRPPRLICATCRAGWIETLGEKTRLAMEPVLQGRSAELAPAEIAAVAGCLVLIAMKAAYLSHHCGICAGDRTHLRHTGQPPKNWSIFVAGLSGTSWSKTCLHRPYRIEFRGNPLTTQSREKLIRDSNTQLLSIGIGPLFFHIFNSPSLLLLNDFNVASRDHGLTPLWPLPRRYGVLPPAKLLLPPALTLTDAEADTLSGAFAHCLRDRLPSHGQPASAQLETAA